MIVAVSAAATPLLLAAVRYLYLASGGSTGLGEPVATIARVVLSALVLAVPTIAMGGTLPAAARAATRDTDVRRQDLAALYALNTLGAVVGCLVATFWLLEIFGTRATIWLAAAVNACDRQHRAGHRAIIRRRRGRTLARSGSEPERARGRRAITRRRRRIAKARHGAGTRRDEPDEHGTSTRHRQHPAP